MADTTIGKKYLSDILDAPFEINQDPEAEGFEFTPPTIFNPYRKIVYKDYTQGVEKLFKLDTETGKFEKVSYEPDLSKYLAPLPDLGIDTSNLSVSELGTITIPLVNTDGLTVTAMVKLGHVEVSNSKVIYTAPDLSDMNGYKNFKDGDQIATDTITINVAKVGYLNNQIQISINILKLALVEDDALVDDDFNTYILETDGIEII